MKTLALTLSLFCTTAHAGTYNFYFNNTEQGANSKASPSVVVKDGKVVTPAEEGAVDEEAALDGSEAGAPAMPVSEPAPVATTVAAAPAMESTFPDAKWKFSIGTMRANYESKSGVMNPLVVHSNTSSKLIGSLTFYPIREAGFSFHVGRFLGPELEINPFGVKTGWGKMQFGVMVAVFKDTVGYEAEDKSTWGTYEYTASVSYSNSYTPSGFWRYPVVHKNPINVFTGAQIGLNVVRDLSLNLAYRIAPIQQNDRITSALHWSANYLF